MYLWHPDRNWTHVWLRAKSAVVCYQTWPPNRTLKSLNLHTRRESAAAKEPQRLLAVARNR